MSEPHQHHLTDIERRLQDGYRRAVHQTCPPGPAPLRIAVVLLLALAFAATIIGLHVSYVLLRRTFVRDTEDDEAGRALRAFADQAVPVMAYPLMINSALRQPAGITAPGLVIISFDRVAQDSVRRMADIAMRLLELSVEDPRSGPDAKYANDLFADEDYKPGRRRKLPLSLSDGLTVYACDLMIHQALIKSGQVDAPFIPCMAVPGDTGRIEMIPYQLFEDLKLVHPA